MQRKTRAALLLVAGLILLFFFVRIASVSREPHYQGRTLSEWSRIYGSNHWSAAHHELEAEAQSAIQAIGTNGIPFVLGQIGARESFFKREARKTLPAKWHLRLHLRDNSGDIRRTGAHGIAALGSNAAVAIPRLIQIARHHPEEDARYVVTYALRTLCETSEPALPFFLEALTNQVAIIRDEAAIGLGSMANHTDLAMPALIQHLKRQKATTHTFELSDALGSLRRLGRAARPATPEVMTLLGHSVQDVREAATNCLLEIDPEAAANAGVRPRPE